MYKNQIKDAGRTGSDNGNIIGGKLTDWRIAATLVGTLLGMAIVMGFFAYAAHGFLLTEATLLVWAVVAFAALPALLALAALLVTFVLLSPPCSRLRPAG